MLNDELDSLRSLNKLEIIFKHVQFYYDFSSVFFWIILYSIEYYHYDIWQMTNTVCLSVGQSGQKMAHHGKYTMLV